MAASEDYPEGLKYHREHDWARIDGDEATLGVTWFAQDALGELVHFEPPSEGASTAKDSSYGEVESVKAVSDVIAPLSGEIIEVNQKVVDAPETVNDDPYAGGLVAHHVAELGGRVVPPRQIVPQFVPLAHHVEHGRYRASGRPLEDFHRSLAERER